MLTTVASAKKALLTGKVRALSAGVATVAVLSALSLSSLPSASAAETTLAGVLASSGANLDTNYEMPGNAVFVAPNGSDAASGSVSQPLATIDAAVKRQVAGGTIVLRGGEYRQSASNIYKKIILQAYPHEKPVINGSDIISQWAKDGSLWRATGWTSPFCQDCFRPVEIDPAYPAAGQVEQVFRNGQRLQQVDAQSKVGPGKFFVNKSSKQLFLGDNPAGVTIEVSTKAQALYFSRLANGSALRGIHVTKFSPSHLDAQAMVLIAASDMTLENSQFDLSSAAGFGIFGPNARVDHVTSNANGAEGASIGSSNNTIVQNSEFSYNNAEHFTVQNCDWACTIAGIKSTRSDGLQVLNNAFVDNDASGWWCDLGCTNATLTGNAITGSSVDGIFFEISSKSRISDNYIQNSYRGIKVAGSDHAVITGNTLVNNKIQVGIYDDPRTNSFDPDYSQRLGLSYNTTNTVLSNNRISGGSSTTWTLDTIATVQIGAHQMFDEAKNNQVSGNQTMVWAKGQQAGGTALYKTIADFSKATGYSFGSFSDNPVNTVTVPATIAPTTTVPPVTVPTTTKPATTAPPTTKAPVTSAPATTSVPVTLVPVTASPPVTLPVPTGNTPKAAAKNLLSNPGFSPWKQQWRAFGTAKLTPTRTHHSGVFGLRVSSTSKAVNVNGAIASPVPVRSIDTAKRYTGSCFVRSSTPISVNVRFQEYSQNWQRLADPVDSAPVKTLKANVWYKVSVTAAPTHAGAQLPFVVYSNELVAQGSTFVVDDCRVTVSDK